jgi:murein L,D-transpeptidase YafK
MDARPVTMMGFYLLALLVAGLMAWRFAPTPPPQLPQNAAVDLIIVHKAARRLELYRGDQILRSFAVSLGSDPIGPKRQEGDGRTPEGEYRIDYRKADSSFHRALHISYPGPADIAGARSRGVNPGELVMIHGTKNGLSPNAKERLPADWTDGCIAVTDEEMDEIWRAVPGNTKIVITP